MKRIILILYISLLIGGIAKAYGSEKPDQLFQAVKSGNVSDVNAAINSGTDINTKDSEGLTLLMLASQEGRVEVVRLLLEKGARVNVKEDGYGRTALILASRNGHTDVVKSLLEKGADVNIKQHNGSNAL
jgi:uncharacterized protein